jgi:uncharacterized membrane protein
MKRLRAAMISLLTMAMLAVAAPPARAAATNVLVCNHFNQRMYLALGYQASDGWNSIGWWTIDPSHCTPFTVPYQQFWFRGETDEVSLGNGESVKHSWSGDRKLYIANSGGFHYSQADKPHANSRLEGFDASIKWTGSGNIRERIVFAADGKNTIQTAGSGADVLTDQ